LLKLQLRDKTLLNQNFAERHVSSGREGVEFSSAW
jgi:hypothetical protein